MKIVQTYPASMKVSGSDPRCFGDEPHYVELHFEEGRPVALNGRAMELAAMVASLNDLASKYGVLPGATRYEGHEGPGIPVLLEARKALNSHVAGVARVGLFRGPVFVSRLSSLFSSYDPSLSAYDMGNLFDGPSATVCDLGNRSLRMWPA